MSLAKPNSIVDTVDSRNRVIGVSRRFELIQNGLNFRTVHVIVEDSRHRVVLQRLPSSHQRSPSKLGSSVAGYLLEGETYSEAAHRKIIDELGFDADIVEVGDFEMIDVNSSKFVKVYKCRHLGTFDDYDRHEIAALERRTLLWLKINTQLFPQRFTSTFLKVFKMYRKHVSQTNFQ